MHYVIAVVLAITIVISGISPCTAGRGAMVIAGTEAEGEIELYQRSYALVIGIDEYTNGWPRLNNAVADAQAVAKTLRRRGFEVEALENPDADTLENAIEQFVFEKGSDPEARLVIWFAGHGHTTDGEGYLVPADAPDASEGWRFRRSALSLRRFGEYMREVRSKHVLAVFDSCFSGTVFASNRSIAPDAISRATTLPVRQFVSSGEAEQVVSDDGAFRKLFTDALDGLEPAADANSDGYLTGSELGLFLTDKMTNLTNGRQTPRSGKLNAQGLDRGDFVFSVQEICSFQEASLNSGVTADCLVNDRHKRAIKTFEEAFGNRDYSGAVKIFDENFLRGSERPRGGPVHGEAIAALVEQGRYESALTEILIREQLEKSSGYELWSDIALVARKMYLADRRGAASAIARTFAKFDSKYKSEIWQYIPGSSTRLLNEGAHTTLAVFPVSTENRKIRGELKHAAKHHQADPFISVVHYTLGEYEKALATNKVPELDSVLKYAAAYTKIYAYYEKATEDFVRGKLAKHDPDTPYGEIYDDFEDTLASSVSRLRAYIKQYPRSKHNDDAVFWLAWSLYHSGKAEESLSLFADVYYSKSTRNPDYFKASRFYLINMISDMSFAGHSAFLKKHNTDPCNDVSYVIARAAFRGFHHDRAEQLAAKCLRSMSYNLAEMPDTTLNDPLHEYIDAKLNYQLDDEYYWKWGAYLRTYVREFGYLYAASRELSRFARKIDREQPEIDKKKYKQLAKLIKKYGSTHKDARQAGFIARKIEKYITRKSVRISMYYSLIQYTKDVLPSHVEGMVNKIEEIDPKSKLLDDAYAELIYVKTQKVRNLYEAERLLWRVIKRFPRGNALDNAMNWVAIAHKVHYAEQNDHHIDDEIIKRFPTTRFAFYAWWRKFFPWRSDELFFRTQSNALYEVIAPVEYFETPDRRSRLYGMLPEKMKVRASALNQSWIEFALGKKSAYASLSHFKCLENCSD